MVKEVIHAPILLGVKSEKATIEDLQVADAFVCQLSTNDAIKMVASQVSGNAV
mgnify:FL=1